MTNIPLLYRQNYKKWIFGVCSGLESITKINRLIFRLAFLGLNFFGGFGFLIYILIAYSLSEKNSTQPSPRYSGLLSFISKKKLIDISILRMIVVLGTFVTGIVPGVILYILLSYLLVAKITSQP